MKVKIRDMERKDTTEAFDLECKTFGYKVRFDKELLYTRLMSLLNYGYSYVAVYKKKVIGHLVSFVTRSGDIYIDFLCVESDYKRKGVGRALINKLKEDNPRCDIFLRTNENGSAIKFYLSMGFNIFKIDDEGYFKDIILKFKRK